MTEQQSDEMKLLVLFEHEVVAPHHPNCIIVTMFVGAADLDALVFTSHLSGSSSFGGARAANI